MVSFDGELVSLSEQERINGREVFDFYCFLLWPFIESYWLAAVALTSLLDRESTGYVRWASEKDFLNKVQSFGKSTSILSCLFVYR